MDRPNGKLLLLFVENEKIARDVDIKIAVDTDEDMEFVADVDPANF